MSVVSLVPSHARGSGHQSEGVIIMKGYFVPSIGGARKRGAAIFSNDVIA